MKSLNHYSTLHVDRCASCAEIKSAFRTLAQRFHPDVTNDRDGERKFKAVNEAYRTLKRPDSKIAYDHQINNICTDQAVQSINLQNAGSFNWGVAMFRYLNWFWLNQGRDDK
ncbi:MAG: Heat shock protein DnaJ, N-terminal [Proteobacteria bacterium]|nr:Heat shock protein DnaJ, N-terminal [Pseudomonadota bacterium]